MRGVAGLDRDVELARPSPARRGTAAGDRPRGCWRRAGRASSRSGRARPDGRRWSGGTTRCGSSRSSSRTMIEARMRGSILPPHRIEPDALAGKALRLRQHRGEARRARAFRHRLLQASGTRSPRARCAPRRPAAMSRDQCAHDRQRQRADVLHRDAFGQASRRRSGGSRRGCAFHIDG